jgi:hypothetical protein
MRKLPKVKLCCEVAECTGKVMLVPLLDDKESTRVKIWKVDQLMHSGEAEQWFYIVGYTPG